jgi:hypothetical protein
MELKKTTKWDGKLKDLHFEGDDLIDENGEVIDLNKHMKAAYGTKTFTISATAKEEEILEVEVTLDEELE